jgi:hypothetical protein
MKQITIKRIVALFLFLVLVIPFACKDSMDDLNVNPNAPTNTNPDYLFTYSVVKGMGSYITNANFNYWTIMNWNMYFATLGGVDAGKEYDSNDGKDAWWNEVYSQGLINAREVQNLTNGNAYLINKNAIAKIWECYLFSQLTDAFGDIPFSQALNGKSLNLSPAYDKQSTIYPALINQLKNASALLDVSKPSFGGNSDPIFKGSVIKWQQFANSLQLRLAMRISNVQPQLTQQVLTELVGQPLLLTNVDNAYFPYNGEIRNPLFDLINSGQSGGRTYPSKFLIDYLKLTSDPRLKVFAQYTTESMIIGFPDYEGVPNLVPSGSSIWNNYNSDGSDVSKIGTWFLRQDAPGVLMSAAEVNFLLSEAALNGWWSLGSPQQYYFDGINLSMQSYPNSSITSTQIANYLSVCQPVTLEGIITQKYISYAFQNGLESYSEYRRTGYPVLTDYSNNSINLTNFPNRLTYPAKEASLNGANYNQAIIQQGPDIPTAKVWWDVN